MIELTLIPIVSGGFSLRKQSSTALTNDSNIKNAISYVSADFTHPTNKHQTSQGSPFFGSAGMSINTRPKRTILTSYQFRPLYYYLDSKYTSLVFCHRCQLRQKPVARQDIKSKDLRTYSFPAVYGLETLVLIFKPLIKSRLRRSFRLKNED